MTIVADIINSVRRREDRTIRRQLDSRQALIQDLECGRYRQHRDDWHDDAGHRVCVLGAAYETARRQAADIGIQMPALPDALAQLRQEREAGRLLGSYTPHRIISRAYGFDRNTQERLALANDQGAEFTELAAMIRGLPPPEYSRPLRLLSWLLGPTNRPEPAVAMPVAAV